MTTVDTIPKVNFGTEMMPRTRVDPPIGDVYGLIDQRAAEDFFSKYSEFKNNLRPWDNQNNYPKTLRQETRYFIRDFYERQLLFLRSQTNKYMPLRIKDTLETNTVILEVRPNLAKKTELRAPKVDLEGISWDQFRTSSVLYGAQATVHFNYGDNDVYGEGMVKYQIKALWDGFETATLLAAYLYLVEDMPNQYYTAVYTNQRRELDFDDMWDRETTLWDASSEPNGLQKVVVRKVKELRIQGGRASTLLISENLNNWLIFQKDNILKFNPLIDDGAFNKIFGLRNIQSVGNETNIDILPGVLMPDGFEWEVLQTHTVRGGVYELGRINDEWDYKEYNLYNDQKKVTDSDKREIASLTLKKCLEYSYLFDKNGKLRNDINGKPISSDPQEDMFATHPLDKDGNPAVDGYKHNKFYQPLIDWTVKEKPKFHHTFLKPIADAMNGAFERIVTKNKLDMSYLSRFKIWQAQDYLLPGHGAGNDDGQENGFEINNWDRLTTVAKSNPAGNEKVTNTRTILKETVKIIQHIYDFIVKLFDKDVLKIGVMTDHDVVLSIMFGNTYGFNLFKYEDIFQHGDWKLAECTKYMTNALNSYDEVCRTLMTVYMSAEITENHCHALYDHHVPLTWFWLAIQPKKEYIGESGIAIEEGGQTLSRSLAMPESRIGESIEGQYYKIYFQAFVGVDPGLPENFGTFDNIHIVSYLSGDTTTPTEWVNERPLNGGKTKPDLFFTAIPFWFQKPRNFYDISNRNLGGHIGQSRCIPNWNRYDMMWSLAPKNDKETYFNYIGKRLPNDVLAQLRYKPKFNNYLLAFEPYFQFNPKTKEEVMYPSTGFWKKLSYDFYNERYSGKSVISSRRNPSYRY